MALKIEKSFTVIEILITVIIISLLVIFGVPSFSKGYKRLKYEYTVQKVYSFFHYGYNYALTRHGFIDLNIYPDKNEFVLKMGRNNERKIKLPDNYSIESDLSAVQFGFFGTFELVDAIDPKKRGMRFTGYLKIIDNKNGWESEIDFYTYWGGIVLKKL